MKATIRFGHAALLTLLAGAPAMAQGLTPTGALLPATGYGSTSNYFGRAAALYTDWALVGSVGLGGEDGEAHVFEEQAGKWRTRALLAAPAGLPAPDTFGAAVALGHGLALVGAPGTSGRGASGTQGRVVVFDSPDGVSWTAGQVLQAASPSPGDGFGTSLAVQGDVLVVGVPGGRAAELWRRTAGTWSRAQVLRASSGDERLGAAVAFDGTLVAAGAPRSERVHLFEEVGGTFVHRSELRPWLALRGSDFGASLAVQEGDVLVGAPEDDDSLGSVYLFEREGAQWRQSWAFLDPWKGVETYFGQSLGFSGQSVVIGAPGEEDVLGAVYLYQRRAGAWLRTAAVIPPPLGSGQFGAYVAAYRDQVLTSIGLDDTLPFGYYGGAILVWSLSDGAGPTRLGASAAAGAGSSAR